MDYDVEMTEIFRGEGNDVFVGSVVTLRTMYDKHICPVRTMKEGDYFYFAVGEYEGNSFIDLDQLTVTLDLIVMSDLCLAQSKSYKTHIYFSMIEDIFICI